MMTDATTKRLVMTAILIAIGALFWLIVGRGVLIAGLLAAGIAVIWGGAFLQQRDALSGKWIYLLALVLLTLLAFATFLFSL